VEQTPARQGTQPLSSLSHKDDDIGCANEQRVASPGWSVRTVRTTTYAGWIRACPVVVPPCTVFSVYSCYPAGHRLSYPAADRQPTHPEARVVHGPWRDDEDLGTRGEDDLGRASARAARLASTSLRHWIHQMLCD
jgi:hypothetical protein